MFAKSLQKGRNMAFDPKGNESYVSLSLSFAELWVTSENTGFVCCHVIQFRQTLVAEISADLFSKQFAFNHRSKWSFSTLLSVDFLLKGDAIHLPHFQPFDAK